jgi:hypothetical protein
MDATYFSPVPCQSVSGGIAAGNSTSTGIECPWFARIFVLSSLKVNLCLLSVRTIFSSISLLNSFSFSFLLENSYLYITIIKYTAQ